MTSILGYLGVGQTLPREKQPVSPPPKQKPIRALPGPWYTAPEMFQLERRAIFSKRWLLVTHKSRLAEPGAFLRYEIADFDIVLNADKTGAIRAFHNVCRHRAYPVVEKDCGNARIFACRYHGWSYGLDGKLAKAPKYQELDGFDKDANGLFPIHTHVDVNGFIFINMDASPTPEVSWAEHFADVDKQERFEQFNFDDYVLDHTYSLDGAYNWKILADNFNECYHCKTTHADVPSFLTIDSADVDVKDGHMQHDHASTPEQRARGMNVNSTYYFPNASMSVSPHWLMIQKFLPTSPTSSSMHYEIYRNRQSREEDFKLIADTYARVMAEDKVLCDRAQRNINRGVFVNGEMHPRWEKGPLFFQQSVREALYAHFEREKSAGAEIWPARQTQTNEVTEKDLEVCSGVKCEGGGELAW